MKSARVVEVAKSSSIPSADDDNLVWIIVGATVGGIIITAIVIVVSVVCHKKKKSKKSNDCEVIVAKKGVYIVEDGVAMTEMPGSQPTSDISSTKPESESVRILQQAFEE